MILLSLCEFSCTWHPTQQHDCSRSQDSRFHYIIYHHHLHRCPETFFFYRCFFSAKLSLCRFSLDITIRFRDNEHSFAEDIKKYSLSISFGSMMMMLLYIMYLMHRYLFFPLTTTLLPHDVTTTTIPSPTSLVSCVFYLYATPSLCFPRFPNNIILYNILVVSIRTLLFSFLDKATHYPVCLPPPPPKANQSMKRRRYTSEELRVKKIVKSKGWGAVPAEWTLGLGMTLGWVPPSSPPHHQSLSYLSNPYICSNIIFSLSLHRRLRSRLLFLFFSLFFFSE